MSPPGANAPPGRLYVYNGGFLISRRIRRILVLAGWDIRLGWPSADDRVGVWGQSPTSHRGEAVAERTGAPLLRVEDAFLRSLHPGRAGDPPMGLMIDRKTVHFDPSAPSDLETLLATHPLDDTALLDRARAVMARLKEAHLTKYAAVDPDLAVPEPGYVLVVDQTRDDASVHASGGDAARFREMLVFAQEDHPGARIVIKTHPETAQGYRSGYFSESDCNDRISLLSDPVSPWSLLDGAVGVYTLSSQLGFEAILAGHKPRVFGQPFYAGWGLTEDDRPVPRRTRRLTRAQLVAAALILYPVWYNPHTDQLCEVEDVINCLDARARAWRADRHGWVASGMRLWKRRPMKQVFGPGIRFEDTPDKARADGRPWMVWASKATSDHHGAVRVEDGFLRSRGLGAALVPPLSLVTDRTGIYYDATGPSDLESLIATRATLRSDQARRAERLITWLATEGVSKYNLGGQSLDLPPGRRILVPGQVEDDASIKTGAGQLRSNLDLLRTVRAANPDAILIYKPHPDVEAGLRTGAVAPDDLATLADIVAQTADPAHLLSQVDEVWTITSLLGFEALVRGVPVVTLGTPFYAGWGLTRDLNQAPDRRKARPTREGLVHATLIDYPRYFDPLTGTACPVEVVVDRLVSGRIPSPGLANRSLSKLQGLFATFGPFWR